MDSVGIKPDLYGAGRGIDLCDKTFQILFRKILQDLITENIVAYRADHIAFKAELGHVIGKICRCAADFLSFRKHIPKDFANTCYNTFFHNDNTIT